MIEEDEIFERAIRYQRLVAEIGSRLQVVGAWLDTIADDPDNNHSLILMESCYLQFRMCCETLGLALISLHEGYDIPLKIKKDYRVSIFIDFLDELRGDYYPLPIQSFQVDDGKLTFSLRQFSLLGPDELKEVYVECSKRLHRNTAKHLFEKVTKEYNLPTMKLWSVLFFNTLYHHSIMLPDGRFLIVNVAFRSDQETKSVIVETRPSS